MAEIPEDALAAATEALSKASCTHTLAWCCAECGAHAAVEAAAPFLAGRIARLIRAAKPNGKTQLTFEGGVRRAAKVARAAFPPWGGRRG